MFSSTGLFKHIKCPYLESCSLPACIFLHDSEPTRIDESKVSGKTEYDPFSAGDIGSPPKKRRRLDSPSCELATEDSVLSSSNVGRLKSNDNDISITPNLQIEFSSTDQRPDPSKTETKSTFINDPNHSKSKTKVNSVPNSITRPISPPALTESKQSRSSQNIPKTKIEQLTPRNVAQAPAIHKTRLTILQAMHQQMVANNQKVVSQDGEQSSHGLSDQELAKLALDEEEEAATKLKEGIYRNSMAQKIQKLKKMTLEGWRQFVIEKIGDSSQHSKGERQHFITALDVVETGLSSSNEEIEILKYLRTPLGGLERFGYVTTQPSDEAISETRLALKSNAGFENCERCGTRFQVFPGRDDKGRLTTGGECRYHWARIGRNQWRDGFTGPSEPTFGCCNLLLGSQGCTESETHVFKVSDPVRLASLLQFEHTLAKSDTRKRHPMAFDCEMAYTTFGMEVIRVTAISWPQREELLDVLVRPYGEILDLNTRFSGVSAEQFAAAPPYETLKAECGTEHIPDRQGERESNRLRKVESPAVARELLFDLINPDTPLIGHAIENDLNTCRIIHPFVIDTVLLYPHLRGLPIRFSLKVLAQKYLNRGIQLGGQSGHDSKEDAAATADLVAIKVREKWKMLKQEGWTFEDGLLVAPKKNKTSTLGPKAAL